MTERDLPTRPEVQEDIIDEAAEESFPASDPPAWVPLTGIGPPADETSPRQHDLARLTRQEHDALLAAMRRLEAALAAAAPGRELAWTARVLSELRQVQEELAEHIASAEGAGGLFEGIDTTRPTLTRRLEHLRQEHATLLGQSQALRQRLESPAPPDFATVRKDAGELLNALRHHQAGEADLIFESFCTDIGAGD